MNLYQLQFDIPDKHPFNREDWYWQAYGEIILPIVQNNRLKRFWFTRYGALNHKPHLLLRYEAKKMVKKFHGIKPSIHHEYNLVDDLGSPRFLGTNRQSSDASQRANLIFDFLHMTANLTLSQLSHKDDQKYWVTEKSADLGNNHFGSPLESIHHLFCNSSATPTAVAMVQIPNNQQKTSSIYPLGLIRAKNSGLFNQNTPVVKIDH
ncbi:MAG: hypothetical protein HN921_11185 [Bacteroidetes bacterium]|nr:hypothetical protein [Bacteroidota bacterium]